MFRQLTDTLYVAPQIRPEDIEAAKALGVTMVVNNRPEEEEPGQPTGEAIEAAARAAGMDYVAVPVSHGGFSPWQLDGLKDALDRNGDGKLLAYCRSGTRSTLLWALTQARSGEEPAALAAKAERAGYDLGPVRQIMDALAAEARK